jgi:hypothetical protein
MQGIVHRESRRSRAVRALRPLRSAAPNRDYAEESTLAASVAEAGTRARKLAIPLRISARCLVVDGQLGAVVEDPAAVADLFDRARAVLFRGLHP